MKEETKIQRRAYEAYLLEGNLAEILKRKCDFFKKLGEAQIDPMKVMADVVDTYCLCSLIIETPKSKEWDALVESMGNRKQQLRQWAKEEAAKQFPDIEAN